MGIWMGLGAVGLSTVMGIIVSMSVRDDVGGGAFGDIAGGFGLIFTCLQRFLRIDDCHPIDGYR